MYAGRGPARKKSREHGTTPGEVGYEASTRKPRVKAPDFIVRLGTDSVNSFRQQIYKSLVSVALKSQTAKPPGVDTDGFAFSPVNAFGAAFSGGCRTGARPDQKSIQLRPLTFYGNSSSLAMLVAIRRAYAIPNFFDSCARV